METSDKSTDTLPTIHWPNTHFMQSVADPTQFPDIELPQIAVAGHSNVGKSSLMNALFGRNGLVKTSKSPGCTRLLNLFDVDDQLLVVDLPGYGYARAPKKEQKRWINMIESYLVNADLKLVLLLLDIRHGPKDSDLQLIEWLNEGGIRWLPVATKADKLSGNKRSIRLKEMTEAMGGLLSPMPTSSFKGMGIDKLRKVIQQEMLRAE
ncbi:YihA family ribosome biogenesis GTP-binding protein [Mariprofundus sp. EBB-1]|uniref:ribosome biogenesis GTP-binding protein YihA/YsxC n=1 Tax=Mariprofundus sp. EBB-1 TaxID=2650971 RepID=UPI000EF23DCC|nr:ribosome biogenesis GTP-binding protein YihA/YsxC [Mariprofundus sp. EBB-1]RLL50080.1 YihA family ribosome biogenesis GTP-binding protein [Mariprofundus sp. EBB-1]